MEKLKSYPVAPETTIKPPESNLLFRLARLPAAAGRSGSFSQNQPEVGILAAGLVLITLMTGYYFMARPLLPGALSGSENYPPTVNLASIVCEQSDKKMPDPDIRNWQVFPGEGYDYRYPQNWQLVYPGLMRTSEGGNVYVVVSPVYEPFKSFNDILPGLMAPYVRAGCQLERDLIGGKDAFKISYEYPNTMRWGSVAYIQDGKVIWGFNITTDLQTAGKYGPQLKGVESSFRTNR